MLQHSFIVGCSAESSSLELNALDILLLRLLQLNASMKTVGSLCEGATEASGTLQQNPESDAVNNLLCLDAHLMYLPQCCNRVLTCGFSMQQEALNRAVSQTMLKPVFLDNWATKRE